MNDYIYATARIRALETKVFTKDDAGKLLETTSGEEIISFLVSANYGRGVVGGIEAFLQSEIDGVRSLLVSLVPAEDAGLIDIADESMGIVSPPDRWGNILDASRANDFLHGLIKTLIDINNIRAFFNFRFFSRGDGKEGAGKLIDEMIPGGHLTRDWFIDKCAMDPDGVASHIKNTSYGSTGILPETGKSPETMSGLGVLFDNYISEYLSEKTRGAFSDISPLIRYIFLKKQEAVMVRTIWYGKENGTGREEIIKHLRGMYA
ncbi:MAG: V-type ATPase subunit [Elusimicrobiota bacterium]